MAESLDSYRARLDGAAIATYVMVMLIVPLKIWCRKKTGGLARLGLDDALSVVTLVFANVFFYITMIGKFLFKLQGNSLTFCRDAAVSWSSCWY